MEWYDYVRVVNCILALASLYNVAKRFNRDKYEYTKRLTNFSLVFQGFLLLTFLGTLEQIIDDVQFGFRMLLTTGLLIVCFATSFREEGLVKEGYHG